jgi:hypothetical protein
MVVSNVRFQSNEDIFNTSACVGLLKKVLYLIIPFIDSLNVVSGQAAE